jgi:hypothetical protein
MGIEFLVAGQLDPEYQHHRPCARNRPAGRQRHPHPAHPPDAGPDATRVPPGQFGQRDRQQPDCRARSSCPLTALQEVDGKTRVWIIDSASRPSARVTSPCCAATPAHVLLSAACKTGDKVVSAGVSTASRPDRKSDSIRKARNEWEEVQPVRVGSEASVICLVFDVRRGADAGIFSYMNLGRAEDPSFAIKTMVIQTRWPGATVDETLLQVTDRIEKKLEELDSLDYVQSYTRPGESTVFVFLKDTTEAKAIPQIWYQVRKKIDDIRGDFPQGIQGPGFDDEFGDVYGTIYAFTGDGFTMRQLRDYVEHVRTGIRDVPNRGKVMTIGEQDETFYLNFSTRKLAALGLDQQHVLQSLQAQNAVTPAGVIEAGPERMSVRTSGQFHTTEDLAAVNLRVNDRFYRLADIAEISRGYVDPARRCFITTASPPSAWPSP